MLNTIRFFYNDDSRIVGRCHLVLISAGSNLAAGLDVRSRLKSALSSDAPWVGGALVQFFLAPL